MWPFLPLSVSFKDIISMHLVFFLQYVSEDRISKKLNLAFSRSFGPTYEAPGGGMVINITINISLIQEMLPTKNDNN